MNIKERVVSLGLLMNVGLAAAKFAAGLFSHSVGLVADAIHSSSDVIASIALLIGVKLSKKKSKNFPFGMYKLENLVALFTAFAIFFAGHEILKKVLFEKNPYDLQHVFTAITVEVLAILVTFLFSGYEGKVGQAEESPGLIADSKHVRSDMLSSFVIVIGLIASLFKIRIADKIAAVIVAVLIFKAGYEVALDAIRVLLDASLDYKTLDIAKSIIESYPLVSGVREITGRNSGSYKFIDAVIELKTKDLDKAHRVVSDIEARLKKEIPHVDSVMIHYEPVEKRDIVVAVPLSSVNMVSDEFGSSEYFYIATAKNGNLSEEKIVKNPFASVEKGKGIKTAEFLCKQGIDLVILKKPVNSPGPKYVFDDCEVNIIVSEDICLENLSDIVYKYIERNKN
jgi:cation diffusion facilitator family transporter